MTPTDEITHIVINCQVLNNRIHSRVANKPFSQKLKNISKQFIEELLKVERDFYDKFFDKTEESTVVVYDTYDTFMKTIATIPIWEMENLTKVLEAYNKDRKSMEGITNKILR